MRTDIDRAISLMKRFKIPYHLEVDNFIKDKQQKTLLVTNGATNDWSAQIIFYFDCKDNFLEYKIYSGNWD